MNRRISMALSAIGKKELMALTGLGFLAFLLVHLAGNLTIFAGGKAFDGYAAKLESLGPLVWIAEAGMVVLGLVHVVTGTSIILRNLAAKGKYLGIKRWSGGQTLGSYSMWLTGPWILVFVAFHLAHFTFPHKLGGDETPLSQMVANMLSNPYWAGFYFFSFALIGLHVSHGCWSAVQTLGIFTSRKGSFRELSVVIGLVLASGFAMLALIVLVHPGMLESH